MGRLTRFPDEVPDGIIPIGAFGLITCSAPPASSPEVFSLWATTEGLMRTPATQPEATIDYHPDRDDVQAVLPRPGVTFVAARSSTELELLLRKRLRFFGLLFLVLYALFA